MVIVSYAASVMTALPCASSCDAAKRAFMFAKIDWLIWIVSVAGAKFSMVNWPKFGANTNELWPAVTERCTGLVPATWLARSLATTTEDVGWPDVGGS